LGLDLTYQGFQVNPGFNGNLVLLFSIAVAQARALTLHEGDEIFSLWIADLDGTCCGKNHEENGNIPNGLDNHPQRHNSIKFQENHLPPINVKEVSKKLKKSSPNFRTKCFFRGSIALLQ